MRNSNPITVQVWWTPACGALHIEDNPVSIGLECPDGLTEGWADSEPPNHPSNR